VNKPISLLPIKNQKEENKLTFSSNPSLKLRRKTMSNINNHRVDMNNKQIKDLYSIEAVQDLSHEAAATISGGNLKFSDKKDGKGARRNFLTGRGIRDLGSFNNRASWYEVTGKRDWIVYTGVNFTGKLRRLKAGTRGNLTGLFDNNIASASLVPDPFPG
jgi:hypothetical protein